MASDEEVRAAREWSRAKAWCNSMRNNPEIGELVQGLQSFMPTGLARVVLRAVMEERRRCAKIARSYDSGSATIIAEALERPEASETKEVMPTETRRTMRLHPLPEGANTTPSVSVTEAASEHPARPSPSAAARKAAEEITRFIVNLSGEYFDPVHFEAIVQKHFAKESVTEQ